MPSRFCPCDRGEDLAGWRRATTERRRGTPRWVETAEAIKVARSG